MPYDPRSFDEPDDELRDEEYPEPDDADDLAETTRCRHCGAEVYEDTVRCPHCGEYAVADTSPWSGRSVGWVLLGLVGILAVLWALASAWL